MARVILANQQVGTYIDVIHAGIVNIRCGVICATSNFREVAHGIPEANPVTDSHTTLGVAVRLMDEMLATNHRTINDDVLNGLALSIMEVHSVIACANTSLLIANPLPQEAEVASVLLANISKDIVHILDTIEDYNKQLLTA